MFLLLGINNKLPASNYYNDDNIYLMIGYETLAVTLFPEVSILESYTINTLSFTCYYLPKHFFFKKKKFVIILIS